MIEFSANASVNINEDTSFEVALEKTSEPDTDKNYVIYTVDVKANGNAKNVTISDAMGKALTYHSPVSVQFGHMVRDEATGEYSVQEDAVECYLTSVTGMNITNRLEEREPTGYVEINGTKTWRDDGIQRPESVTIRLLRDGTPIQQRTVTAADGWTYGFGTLPLDDGYGHGYEYTVREDPVEGYFPRYKGWDVFNTKLSKETDEDSFDGFVNLLESNPNLGALTEQELEELMSLFGYKTPSAGLLPTGDEVPWWPIAFGLAGLLALLALLILERKRRA